ncbi:MAG TPA: outer membrane beta-barrel protein [Chitinophaga sp.]
MQRILLSLCTGALLLFAQPKAQAQESPPSFKKNLIGGNFGLSYTKSTNAVTGMEDKNTSVSFAPVYAHYIKPTVAVGASIAYSHYTSETVNSTDEVKTNYYSFRPFIRFEIPLWQSRFAIYNDLGIYGMYAKNDRKGSYEYSWNSWGAGAFYEPGLMFRIKSNIALQASLSNLLSYNYQNEAGDYTHNFGIRSSHSGTNDLTIGINFLF